MSYILFKQCRRLANGRTSQPMGDVGLCVMQTFYLVENMMLVIIVLVVLDYIDDDNGYDDNDLAGARVCLAFELHSRNSMIMIRVIMVISVLVMAEW